MINKEHKDRLYKMIFGNPEHRQWTLNLYNAVNGSDYDDPSQITAHWGQIVRPAKGASHSGQGTPTR